ncbi:hypothetical protein LTR78_000217 [Recurvomyces mirabilis]|uniref:Uncharacterized protein n=1 Tax=Recurvomyces mirabilis TaxID=574656 RepID=A0AAE0WWQ4_9PEZI|nr:hypothetical protein LTR78_000217 [Recurvomyces mirabilis]KAK5161873.1 hypothetical protein LTS14_000218 [Recurvomyces mirabilis]
MSDSVHSASNMLPAAQVRPDTGHQSPGPVTKPNPRRKGTWYSIRNTASKLWLSEASWWIFGTACLLAIVGTLAAYDGRKVPSFRWGITLNTIVSLLASVATAALMVPITSGLAQLKWLWFQKPRKLSDFEIIEDARSGPYGSVKLLLGATGGWMACIGALITIVMLGYGPFVQQIIATPTRGTARNGSSIPVAHWYNSTYQDDGADVPLNLKAAVLSGMLSTNNTAGQWLVQPTCQTGNCTWPSYASLAMCSTCADLTSHLNSSVQPYYGGHATEWQLPNGVNLTVPLGQFGNTMVVNNTNDVSPVTDMAFESVAFTDSLYPLLDMFVVVGNYSSKPDNQGKTMPIGPFASECRVTFCIQQYNASSTNGSFSETAIGAPVLLNTSTTGVNLGDADNITAPSGGFTLSFDDRNFTIDYGAIKAFWFYLPTLFSGKLSQSDSLSPQPLWPSDMAQAVFQHLNATPHTLDSMFRNIADSMTLAIRTQSSADTVVEGKYFVQETYIQVVWPWIALPATVTLVTLLFLIAVAAASRRAGLEPWTSSLAALFHGMKWQDAEGYSHLHEPAEMDEAGSATRVMLVNTGMQRYLEVHEDSTSYIPLQNYNAND